MFLNKPRFFNGGPEPAVIPCAYLGTPSNRCFKVVINLASVTLDDVGRCHTHPSCFSSHIVPEWVFVINKDKPEIAEVLIHTVFDRLLRPFTYRPYRALPGQTLRMWQEGERVTFVGADEDAPRGNLVDAWGRRGRKISYKDRRGIELHNLMCRHLGGKGAASKLIPFITFLTEAQYISKLEQDFNMEHENEQWTMGTLTRDEYRAAVEEIRSRSCQGDVAEEIEAFNAGLAQKEFAIGTVGW